MAPDDEILAEIFALQSELLQEMAINRARLAPLLQDVIRALPRQRADAEQRAEGTQVAKDWIMVSSPQRGSYNFDSHQHYH